MKGNTLLAWVVVVGMLAGWASAETTFISKKSSDWKYLDTGGTFPDQWTAIDFDDSHWKRGAAPLGYETEGGPAFETTIDFGNVETSKHLVTWFRKDFEVEDPSSSPCLVLRVAVDDGAVIHLNGEELTRLRMPKGKVTEKSYSSEKIGGSRIRYRVLGVESAPLIKGTNVLSVSVHQASETSSDMHLDLSLHGMESREFHEMIFPERMKDIIESYQKSQRQARIGWILPGSGLEHQSMNELILAQPSHPDVIAAASWLAGIGKLSEAVVKVLLEQHRAAETETFVSLLMSGQYDPSEPMLSLLKGVIKEHPNPSFQAVATYALSHSNNDVDQKEALLVEALEKIGPFSMGDLTFADRIEDDLYVLRNLDVGKIAPEISGTDLDGVKFNLSDYRGNVVVLVFHKVINISTNSYPHHQLIMKQYQDQPVTLLGVSGVSREMLPFADSHEIAKRSWWDGSSKRGPIASAWRVWRWPTTYILDHKGVIRYKNAIGISMTDAVEALLKEVPKP